MDDLRLLRINYLRGPNIWTYRPALEVWLDLGSLEDRPSNTIPGFNDRLVALLPGLEEHHCGVGERGGFLQRLASGTMAGHILEHIIIELLNLGGMPTGFGQTRSTSRRGVYRMVFRARDERVARTALAEGHRLLAAVLRGEAFDVADSIEAVRDEVDRSYLDPSTACIVAAATERQIPHIRLNAGSLVQFGYGARQHRIWTSETGHTSAIAQEITRDEVLTRSLLATCGVPVPKTTVVHSADEAWEAAQEIGLPVIVKPTESSTARGMLLDLTTEEGVRAAYASIAAQDAEAIVERSIPGSEHRLLVVGGKVVAAARGEGWWVTGDGRSNVQDLVDLQINAELRRRDRGGMSSARIHCATDRTVLLDLKRQGLTPESVPVAGSRVLIQRIGANATDCTDDVHPEVARMVALAVRVVGIDIAGVDVVARDIARPLRDQEGAVLRVNAGPGLLMHLAPAVGAPRPVGERIVEHLFPAGDDGRIPIFGVAGSRNTGHIVRLIAWLMHLGGLHVGLASRAGLCLDRRRADAGDGTRWESARRLLMNHLVEAAIFETTATAILRDGLPYDRCEIGVVHDLDGHERLAEFDIVERDQMFRVMRTQVDAVLPRGAAVLNAADPRIVDMAELCDGEVVLYGLDERNPAIVAHRNLSRRAVFARGKSIVCATGAGETVLADLLEGPHEGPLEGALEGPRGGGACASSDAATLAGVAAAWARGLELDVIVTGVATFRSDLDPFSQAMGDDEPRGGAADGV
jgi:cyanophycin synthetase